MPWFIFSLSIPHLLQVLHFSEEDGIHYVSLARDQEESENNEDGNQYEMTESEEGEKGTDKNVEEIVKQKTAVETVETTQKIKTWERA